MLLVDFCQVFLFKYIYFSLVILQVRDENILKTGEGGDYLVNNYFTRVQDILKKRRLLKKEREPESTEWNELKVIY